MLKVFKCFLKGSVYGLALFSTFVMADQMTPVGRWVSIDDKTGERKSIIEIVESNGELKGKVVEILTKPKTPDDHFCTACEGDRKGKPVKGMEILWGYKQESETRWSDGEILDPDNGKIYSSHLTLEENGKNLSVRGYIGFSLIGRSQKWIRE